jgi:hypothetical protein
MLNFLVANILAALETTAPNEGTYLSALSLVFIVGFIAAAAIGSIAWYNSKRPVGWENKERPEIVPEVKPEDSPGLGSPNINN